MTDEPADLDRLFAILSEEERLPDLDDHPAPEKLSAYQADELSPEEDAALQEHLAHCALCAGLLLDLQRFLNPPPEDLPREGVVDFESAAEWRDLRVKLQDPRYRPMAVKRFPLRKIFGARTLAAVLTLFLFGFGGMATWIAVLKRKMALPITDLTPTTVLALESTRGPAEKPEPTPLRLGHVVAFETQSSLPSARLRLVFRKDGTIRRTLEAKEKDEERIEVFLPESFLPPGVYKVEVQGPEGRALNPPKEFDIRILQ
ncbi:MAG TPA: zf-HC2 domain-containing protein [Thermoanaerobaculia bacterium]|nr:zf-HC2 domain-containing protein [Thermoanaerobaculia bacterium]